MKFQLPKTSYNSPEKREVKSIVEQYRLAREKGEAHGRRALYILRQQGRYLFD